MNKMNYPKIRVRAAVIAAEKDIEVDPSRLVFVEECSTHETRIAGALSGRAYYLTSAFDWVVGKDDKDELVLVPLRKT